MDDPELYSCTNDLTRRDVEVVLEEFVPLMQWRPDGDEVLLDVGCGPGNVTANIIYPRVSKKVRKVVGADISHKMVRHAGDHFAGGPFAFTQLDIADPILDPTDLPSILTHFNNEDNSITRGFHKIFSFFCLNWVQEQRRAVETIMRLLASGGEILLIVLARHAIFDLYEKMAESPQWKQYTEHFHELVSPYRHAADPSADFKSLLEGTGFNVKHCSCRHRGFEFDSLDSAITFFLAVNPFFERIPTAMHQMYIDDFRAEFERSKILEEVIKDGKAGFITRYTIIVVHATKPRDS